MDVIQIVSAVLALLAAAAAVAILVARIVAPSSPPVARILDVVLSGRSALTFAIAAVATAGSLYFSESAGYVPCRMCWFQRIAMYPIAVVALVGLLRRDRAARWYALALAAIGAPISLYHLLIEQGVVADSDSCAAFGPSCADVWFEAFGFMTLASMALAGFVCIVVLNAVSFDAPRRLEQP